MKNIFLTLVSCFVIWCIIGLIRVITLYSPYEERIITFETQRYEYVITYSAYNERYQLYQKNLFRYIYIFTLLLC